MKRALPQPPTLTAYLATARDNAQMIEQNGGAYFRLLSDINDVFVLGESSMQPRRESRGGPFLMAAHASYLAAVNLAISLHLLDAYKPLRGCLESAMYALHVERDPSAWKRWKDRPAIGSAPTASGRQDVIKKRRAVGSEFSFTRIAGELSNAGLRRHAENLYEETIDEGAHHNYPAFKRHFKVVSYRERLAEGLILSDQEPEFVHCFRSVAACGLASLQVMDSAFGTQWDSAVIQSRVAGLHRALEKRHATKIAPRQRKRGIKPAPAVG